MSLYRFHDLHTAYKTDAETDYKTKLAQARAKFGRPFAHEPKSTYQPEPMPFLTRWFRKDANRSSNSLL